MLCRLMEGGCIYAYYHYTKRWGSRLLLWEHHMDAIVLMYMIIKNNIWYISDVGVTV